MTRVVNRHREAFDIYVGRGSRWGNDYSHLPGTRATMLVASREEAVRSYAVQLACAVLSGAVTIRDLAALQGHTLGCYCKPQSCHGDVLATAADAAVEAVELLGRLPAAAPAARAYVAVAIRDAHC